MNAANSTTNHMITPSPLFRSKCSACTWRCHDEMFSLSLQKNVVKVLKLLYNLFSKQCLLFIDDLKWWWFFTWCFIEKLLFILGAIRQHNFFSLCITLFVFESCDCFLLFLLSKVFKHRWHYCVEPAYNRHRHYFSESFSSSLIRSCSS